jgi:ABC-type Fe3+/spermidine/putrescine transport system ATPase subunit
MVVADRMAVMRAGRIVQAGPPREVYERPANRYVAGFIGEVNIFPRDGAWVAVRPEKLTIGRQPNGDEPIAGALSDIAYFGDRTRYVVETAHGPVRVSRANDGVAGEPLHVGDAVWVSHPPDAAVPLPE